MAAETPLPPKRKYRPLDVKTWFEGFLRLIGWILVLVLAVGTGGLWVVYELKVLNVHDTDWRDIDFDQRITNYVNNIYHKNFLLAEQCCNPDPLTYAGDGTCDPFPTSWPVAAPPWSGISPYCKPVIMIECQDINSAPCNSIRVVLYAAAGMSPTRGTPYVNCLRAGRVRVGVEQVAAGRPYTLAAYLTEGVVYDTLIIPNPFETNVTAVQAFVDRVAGAADPNGVDYMQPSSPLSTSIFLAGVHTNSSITIRSFFNRNLRAVPPWTKVSNLWPWPGMNKRCQNTQVNDALQLEGSFLVTIPRFSLASPQDAVVPLKVGSSTLLLGAWSVGPATPPGDTVGGSTDVTVSYLSSVQAAVGMVPLLGACDGWQLSPDPQDLILSYTPHWTGSVASLQAGTSFGPFVSQEVTVYIYDIGGPRRLQLPSYGGMWYIVLAFGMAAIWLFGTGLIILIIPLVWWNIRSNRGLPPIVYRYMKKYRGW